METETSETLAYLQDKNAIEIYRNILETNKEIQKF